MARNPQTTEKIITNEDAAFLRKLIARTIYNGKNKKINMQVVEELNRLFKQLDSLLYKNKFVKDRPDYYSSERGWAKFIHEVKGGDKTYPELFSICLKILEIIRTGELDEGNAKTLVVYSKLSSGDMNIYFGSESNIPTYVKENEGKQQLHYAIKDIKEGATKLQANSAFVQHYNNFYNAAMDIKKKKEKEGKKDAFNEGHIIEAFQRHLYYQHKIHELTPEIALKFKGKESFVKNQWVPINLYYAMNSAGWWTGGDVGVMQIKGDNRKLASIISVKAVASTLLEIYKDRASKNPEERFKEMFTQGDIKQMTDGDPENLAQLSVKEIIDFIGNKNKDIINDDDY